jgi:hypothetical protein
MIAACGPSRIAVCGPSMIAAGGHEVIAAAHDSPASTPREYSRPATSLGWRDEFRRTNPASIAARILFPLAAFATLLPFVSPGIALMLGICLAFTLGNPYQLSTARIITPLLQISVIGLGAGMNLVEVGHAGVHGFFYTVIGISHRTESSLIQRSFSIPGLIRGEPEPHIVGEPLPFGVA